MFIKKLAFIAVLATGLAQTQSAVAADLLWVPASPNWDTSSVNWFDAGLSAQVAFAAGDNVTFDDAGSAVTAVTLNGLLTPGVVVVNASTNYSFSSTTGGKLTNAFSLTKRGTGKLILDSDNMITNSIVVEAGTLEIGAGAGRGAVGSGAITNEGVLSINRTGALTYTNLMAGSGLLQTLPITTGTISMRGSNQMTGAYLVTPNGIINFGAASMIGNPSSITIGPANIGANTRFQISTNVNLPLTCSVYLTNAANSRRCALQSMDGTNAVRGPIFVGPIAAGETNNGLPQLMAMNAGSEFNVYSQVGDLDSGNRYAGSFYLRGTTGSGRLYGTINLPSATLVKTDANGSWTIYSTGNAAATTFIAQGLLRLGVDNGLPNAPLVMGQAASTGILDLAGFNQQVTTLNDIAGANIIANSSTSTDSLLTLSGGGLYAGSIQNSISNGTRTVGLTLLSGAQQFSGALTYSGPTTIHGGGIALIGNGSMSNTISIHIANGSAIDASLRSDGTLSLGAAQTLKGNGTFNITGNLVSQGTLEFKVDKAAGTIVTDKLGVTGQLTYGGKLKLVLSGEALTASDTLPLFSAGAFVASSFAVIEPPQPGAGLTWDTSTLVADGTLRIASAGLSIGTAYIASGSKIVLNASGGAPNAGFTILTSTNVANPVATWDVDQTGNLDASGNISVTNVINLGERQRYFIFRIP